MKGHFFAFLSRMRYIYRWGLMRNTIKESLAEHSFEVSLLSHALCVISNCYFKTSLNGERAALLALYHDAGEVVTGDVPTPVKYYNPAIKSALSDMEDAASGKILSMLPPEMTEDFRPLFYKAPEDLELWRRVKDADKLSAYIKCVIELKMGNLEFSKAACSIKAVLDESPLPETKFFLERFMKSYELSLDEQN